MTSFSLQSPLSVLSGHSSDCMNLEQCAGVILEWPLSTWSFSLFLERECQTSRIVLVSHTSNKRSIAIMLEFCMNLFIVYFYICIFYSLDKISYFVMKSRILNIFIKKQDYQRKIWFYYQFLFEIETIVTSSSLGGRQTQIYVYKYAYL